MAKRMSRYIKQFKIKHAEELKIKDGKTRLSLLAQFLRNIPEDRFCLASWSDEDFEEDVCGTTACAMGWATTIFPQLQLNEGFCVSLINDNGKAECVDFDAGAVFFNIPYSISMKFFDPYSYPNKSNTTAVQVADRIDHYLETGKIT